MRGFRAALVEARRATGGRLTDVYPSLARLAPETFAAAWHGLDGARLSGGDASVRFILMSVAKPFVLALAVDAHGRDAVLARTGMRATGLPFNATEAVSASADGRTNPMVNPGAITVASLVDEAAILGGLARFAGRGLDADPAMVDAIHASNARNRELAGLLDARGLLGCALESALHRYTLQSCLAVSAPDLARMGAVLAAGGVGPDGERVVSERAAATALEAMALAGLYQDTEGWIRGVGLPAKSGIAGGLVMVAAGRGAAAAYSPPLDAAGNPVRAQAFARALAPSLREPGGP